MAALRKLRQEDFRCQAGLAYIVRPCLKKRKKKVLEKDFDKIQHSFLIKSPELIKYRKSIPQHNKVYI
jgi:hypothetical protein